MENEKEVLINKIIDIVRQFEDEIDLNEYFDREIITPFRKTEKYNYRISKLFVPFIKVDVSYSDVLNNKILYSFKMYYNQIDLELLQEVFEYVISLEEMQLKNVK